MIKVGIVGGTGYTGVELLRLLAQHPEARVEVITSRSEEGVKVADMYPNLRGHYDYLSFSVPDVQRLGACDVVFFATPHGVAHALAGELWPEWKPAAPELWQNLLRLIAATADNENSMAADVRLGRRNEAAVLSGLVNKARDPQRYPLLLAYDQKLRSY